MGRKVTRTPATGPDVRAKGLDSETLGRSIGQCLSVKGRGLRRLRKSLGENEEDRRQSMERKFLML